jgi:hypothetical protein
MILRFNNNRHYLGTVNYKYINHGIFGKKLIRAYVVLFYYVPNQNKVFLSYNKKLYIL